MNPLDWVEKTFSEGFLGKLRDFLHEAPGKEFLRGVEDPGRDISLKEGEGVGTGIARFIKLYALDYPGQEIKQVAEMVGKAREGNLEGITSEDMARAALWGFLGPRQVGKKGLKPSGVKREALGPWEETGRMLEAATAGAEGEELRKVFAEVEATPTRVLARELEAAHGLPERTLLREGGTKAPWVWSMLNRTLEKPEFVAAKEMKGATFFNKLDKAGVSKAEQDWVLGKLKGQEKVSLDEVRRLAREEGMEVESKVLGKERSLLRPFTEPELLITEGLITEEEYFQMGGTRLPEDLETLFIKAARHERHFIGKPLPQGEGYRESLVTLKPKPGTGTFTKPEHYDPENVAVGMIADIRRTSEGKKTLHIHEGQPDWSQRARGGVFDPGKVELYDKASQRLLAKLQSLEKRYEDFILVPSRKKEALVRERKLDNIKARHDKVFAAQELAQSRLEAAREAPPPTPFTADKAMELGVKRMLWEAAEEGVEKVTWSTGKDVAERWNLRSVADKVTYNKELGELYTHNLQGGTVFDIAPQDLTKYVTKEQADKLLKDGIIEGKDLEVGKRWPYEIYDKKFGDWVRKATREVGEEMRPGGAAIAASDSSKLAKLQKELLISKKAVEYWQAFMKERKGQYSSSSMEKDAKEQLSLLKGAFQRTLDLYKKELELKKGHPVHSIDFPPSLIEKIKSKGFKMSKKIAQEALEGIA